MLTTQSEVGQARVVRRRTPTLPSRLASYWDFTPWKGGYVRLGSGPGGVRLGEGLVGDLLTGRVVRDPRFTN